MSKTRVKGRGNGNDFIEGQMVDRGWEEGKTIVGSVAAIAENGLLKFSDRKPVRSLAQSQQDVEVETFRNKPAGAVAH